MVKSWCFQKVHLGELGWNWGDTDGDKEDTPSLYWRTLMFALEGSPS
jgi:hypothetical protein